MNKINVMALVFVLLCGSMFAATLYVDNSGNVNDCSGNPVTYTNATAAVEAANNYDTITYCNTGIPYNESANGTLKVDKVGLLITSNDSTGVDIYMLESTNYTAINITADDVTLFHINLHGVLGGDGTGPYTPVEIWYVDNVSITDCDFYGVVPFLLYNTTNFTFYANDVYTIAGMVGMATADDGSPIESTEIEILQNNFQGQGSFVFPGFGEVGYGIDTCGLIGLVQDNIINNYSAAIRFSGCSYIPGEYNNTNWAMRFYANNVTNVNYGLYSADGEGGGGAILLMNNSFDINHTGMYLNETDYVWFGNNTWNISYNDMYSPFINKTYAVLLNNITSFDVGSLNYSDIIIDTNTALNDTIQFYLTQLSENLTGYTVIGKSLNSVSIPTPITGSTYIEGRQLITEQQDTSVILLGAVRYNITDDNISNTTNLYVGHYNGTWNIAPIVLFSDVIGIGIFVDANQTGLYALFENMSSPAPTPTPSNLLDAEIRTQLIQTFGNISLMLGVLGIVTIAGMALGVIAIGVGVPIVITSFIIAGVGILIIAAFP